MTLAALLLAATAAAAPAPLSGRFRDHNVLVISMTAIGAERFGLYGYARDTTPLIDRWARGGLVFESVYSHASWTLPAATSLMTGLHPYTHGVWRRVFHNRLHPKDRTLAELLAGQGYRTAAFAGGLDYHPRFSHLRGFQFRAQNPHYTTFRVTAGQAKDWLAAYGRGKFFLVVQGYDAHCPFKAEPPRRGLFSDPSWRSPGLDTDRCVRGFSLKKGLGPARAGSFKAFYAGHCPRLLDPNAHETCLQGDPVTLTPGDVRFIEASYDETVRQADDSVADLLASLPPEVSSRTIVLLTSEHGELFARHGRFGRAGTRRGAHYDDILRVPLVLRLPGVTGGRVPGLAQLADVMPTLLDLLGLEVPGRVQGRSLLPLAEGRGPVHELVYTGLPYNIREKPTEVDRMLFNQLSLSETARDARWKLVHERVVERESEADAPDDGGERETWELFDVASDPGETRDLSASRPEEASRLRGLLESWREDALSRRRAGARGASALPSELIRQARERGYWE